MESLVIRPEAIRLELGQRLEVLAPNPPRLDKVGGEQALRPFTGAGFQAVGQEERPHGMKGAVVKVRNALARHPGRSVGLEAAQLVEQQPGLVLDSGQRFVFVHRRTPSSSMALSSAGFVGSSSVMRTGRRVGRSSQPSWTCPAMAAIRR